MAPPPTLLTFRPDIEGLRAVAVVLVVLLHAGVTVVSGGYVGVDCVDTDPEDVLLAAVAPASVGASFDNGGAPAISSYPD